VSNACWIEGAFIGSSRIGGVPVRKTLAVLVLGSICRRRYISPGQVI
jgi:hypothetical protein